LVEKPEGKRSLGRQRRRWVDNIIMNLGEIKWRGADGTYLVLYRHQWKALLNTVMNLQVT
jgi:hypothetical protein